MSVQVRRRREAAAFLSTYVGAQGELLVDTTNNRVQVHDGATPGGWPAAKLSEIVLKGGQGAFSTLSATASVTFNLNAANVPQPAGTNLFLANADNANAFLTVSSYSGGGGFHSDVLLQNARGTGAQPSAVQAGDTMGQLQFRGYGATAFVGGAKAVIKGVAAENWTDTANGTFLSFGTCALGVSAQTERLRVDPSGNLLVNAGAQKIADQAGTLFAGAFTVATLPTPGSPGRMAFATNARMFNGAGAQEAAGAGTGGLVVDNGTAWKVAGTNVTASQ